MVHVGERLDVEAAAVGQGAGQAILRVPSDVFHEAKVPAARRLRGCVRPITAAGDGWDSMQRPAPIPALRPNGRGGHGGPSLATVAQPALEPIAQAESVVEGQGDQGRGNVAVDDDPDPLRLGPGVILLCVNRRGLQRQHLRPCAVQEIRRALPELGAQVARGARRETAGTARRNGLG